MMQQASSSELSQKQIPIGHQGADYIEFLKHIHAVLTPRSYFEVGTAAGRTLALANCLTIAVDPKMEPTIKIVGGKEQCHLFRMTSDRFFKEFDLRTLVKDGVDLAFLDGLHWYEVLLRDFINTERNGRRDSVIVLHDCLPFLPEIAERVYNPSGRTQKEYVSYWAGDVWKTLVILKSRRPDLKILSLDCKPTGLILITNLDPSSRVLPDGYFDFVQEMANVELETFGIDKLFQVMSVRSAGPLMRPSMLERELWL